MYIGRFIIIGKGFGGYCVCSRSFPERQMIEGGNGWVVGPTLDAPDTDNPYISYNCLGVEGKCVVIGNGSHVDPIREKISIGVSPRDALSTVLLALDYEKDAYDTPRIAGIIGEKSVIGVVRKNGIDVQTVDRTMLVSTYEKNIPCEYEFERDSAERIAEKIHTLGFEFPVCSIGVTVGEMIDIGVVNGSVVKDK